jgi:hypothetical protein
MWLLVVRHLSLLFVGMLPGYDAQLLILQPSYTARESTKLQEKKNGWREKVRQ